MHASSFIWCFHNSIHSAVFLNSPTPKPSYPETACASIPSKNKVGVSSVFLPYINALEELSPILLFWFCLTKFFWPQSRQISSLPTQWYFSPSWRNPFSYLSISLLSSPVQQAPVLLLACPKSPRLISPLLRPWSSSSSPLWLSSMCFLISVTFWKPFPLALQYFCFFLWPSLHDPLTLQYFLLLL